MNPRVSSLLQAVGPPRNRPKKSVVLLFSARITAGERSVALISTLAVLSIVTILLVAYVSIVSADRRSTSNYANGMRSEQLARGGMAMIISQLQAELSDTSDSTAVTNLTNPSVPASATFPIYRPLKGIAVQPQHMAVPALGQPNLANIVKISVPGYAFYTNTVTGKAGAFGTNFASSSLTTTRSLNGRTISLARWSQPLLVTSTNNFPVPAWVPIGRNGPIAAANAFSLRGADAVMGRYAYVVYDVSGLIDINVAGHPAAVNSGSKGLLPWADLTSLGVSAGDSDALVRWRNSGHVASYASYVSSWSTNGFRRVAEGDTAFLTRQELIRYAQTQAPTLTNALPYLTTFSRELNGPVCAPLTNVASSGNFAYKNNQYAATTMTGGTTNVNPFILNPRLTGSYTNNAGISRKAGEPYVKYRFPLGKLSLVEAGADTVNIQKYFGLTKASDYSSTYQHWIYSSPDGVTTAATIKTLDQAAAMKRDPDFFELLQAGILNGSLGRIGRADNNPAINPDPDGNPAYQIIRIGANIIDQWDADSYPTVITFGPSPTFDFYGTEDLPYLNESFYKAYSPAGTANYTNNVNPSAIQPATFKLYQYFELWNPHRDVGSSGAKRPTSFQIAPVAGANGDAYSVYLATSDSAGNSYWYLVTPTTQLSSLPSPSVTFTAGASDFREPSLITTNQLAAPVLPNAALAGGVAGVYLGPPDPAVPAAGVLNTTSSGPAGHWPPAINPATGYRYNWGVNLWGNLVYKLQYQDSAGYHTYATFVGFDKSTPLLSPNPGLNPKRIWTVVSQADTATALSFAKSDPRTQRWGAGVPVANPNSYAVYGTSDANGAGHSLTPGAGQVDAPITQNIPFHTGLAINNGSPPYRMDMWAVNDTTVTPSGSAYSGAGGNATDSYYGDPDGAYRPGDAYKAYGATHSPLYTGDVSRPVILNRPFQSVGELGYAFRDMPWKTLDFFSPQSADSALLDLFSLSEGAVIAGRVNPNAAPTPVLTALLSGAALSWSSSSTNTLTANGVGAVATAFRDTVTNSVTGHGPFLSRADIVPQFMGGFMASNQQRSSVTASGLKTEAETITRSIVESANVRTWNFLVDIIAQSGRYPQGATSADQFEVDGQRRYWLHIAIDRYTGEIVDQQLEVVSE